jgi:hypothetical protein
LADKVNGTPLRVNVCAQGRTAYGLRARRGARSVDFVREDKKQPSVKERLETVKGRIQEVVDQAREGHAFRRQGASAPEESTPDGRISKVQTIRLRLNIGDFGFRIRGQDDESERILEATLGQQAIRAIHLALQAKAVDSEALRNVDIHDVLRTIVGTTLESVHVGARVEWG